MQNDPGSQRIQLDPSQIQRVTKTGRTLLTLALILFGLVSCIVPYTDFLWFSHDARHPDVFETAYGTRGVLMLLAFVLSWIFIYFNVKKAFKVSLIFLQSPQGGNQMMMSNLIDWITRKGAVIVSLVAPLLAFTMATEFSTEWNTLLLARHPQVFGVKDPMLNLDLGFYVFSLPWYRALSNYVFGVLLVTTIISVAVYIGLQALALIAKIELSRPHIRAHISTLVGITFISYAVQVWLKTYEYGLIDSGHFTGAGYSASYQFGFERLLAVIIGLVGIASILGQKVGRPYAAPSYGGVVIAVFYLVVVQGATFVIQRFVVVPDPFRKEAQYARRAIDMTRFGYGLDKITARDWDPVDAPTAAQVADSKQTLDNMRLWDPEVLRHALEGLQSFKQFYSFNDVDIDRYTVKGKETMLMLSPRDMNVNGLPAQAQNWANQRLRYTHGYGLTISEVDTSTADGQPTLLTKDMPVQSIPDIPVTEPRIYFNNMRDEANDPVDEYALVDTGQAEFDYPTSGNSSAIHQWAGDRGVPIGGLISRLAFSILLGDGNLLISGNVKGNTRLLMRRNILERAGKIYPFLRFDPDPYIVVSKGRMVWILDGYTSSDMIPYSERTELNPRGSLNYVRNSVKIVIDAYTGESTAFAIEPDEPLLKAYRQIYPGLVKNLNTLPDGLTEHFRYPEQLFQMQSAKLLNYHATDTTVFLTKSDAWDIARERDLNGDKAPIRPYYVLMKLRHEAKPQFQLILPFTPYQKPNMSGWLTAQCDPGVYGQMNLYRFKGPLPKGPELMEADFSSTPAISYINRQYRNDQSDVIVGNLLVIPIGKSVMYSESLFLQSKTQGIQAVPKLFRVILALNNKVVVGETYTDALKQLFQSEVAPATNAEVQTPSQASAPPVSTQPTAQTIATAKNALELFDQANTALKQGDFAKYGELQKRLRKQLADLAAKP